MTDRSSAIVPPQPEENTSGRGRGAVVPPELDRWNWGAFILTWIWGLGNRTYIALLIFVPFVNVAMPFVLGFYGSRWAWQNRTWNDTDHFKKVQRNWSIVAASLMIGAVGFAGFKMVDLRDRFGSLEPVQFAIEQIESDPRVAAHLGAPVETGRLVERGTFHIGDMSGTANFALSASGPDADGTVYVAAEKALGEWRIEHFVLELDETGQRIDITTPPN